MRGGDGGEQMPSASLPQPGMTLEGYSSSRVPMRPLKCSYCNGIAIKFFPFPHPAFYTALQEWFRIASNKPLIHKSLLLFVSSKTWPKRVGVKNSPRKPTLK